MIQIDPELYKKFKGIATLKGQKIYYAIAQAVKMYIESNEVK